MKLQSNTKAAETVQTTSNPAVAQERLVRRLRDYHRQLDTHQKKREAGMLILEAADEIDRLESADPQLYNTKKLYETRKLERRK
jgi:hypothetical protein